MRIKDNYVVSSVAGENIILPIDNDCVDYNSVYILNDTGMFIVNCLPAEYDEIVEKLVEKYDISTIEANEALDTFLAELSKYEIFE